MKFSWFSLRAVRELNEVNFGRIADGSVVNAVVEGLLAIVVLGVMIFGVKVVLRELNEGG